MGCRFLTVILLSGLLAACNSSLESRRDRDATPAPAPAKDSSQQNNAAPEAPALSAPTLVQAPAPVASAKTVQASVPKSVETSKPVVTEKPQSQQPPPPPEDLTADQFHSPLLTQGHLDTFVPEYQIPDKVRERLEKFQPELATPKSTAFEIVNQNLNIDAKKKTVTFRGSLRIKGKNEEPFELSCKIDTSSTPWICQDLLPTNGKLAAQRRIQGTFKCLDPYICDNRGVALWVVIDGVLQGPKLFQAQGFDIRRVSIDEEEDDLAETIEDLTPKIQDRLPQEPDSKNEKAAKPQPDEDVKVAVPLPQPRPQITLAPRQPELTSEEINKLLDNPEVTLEISEPMSMPSPAVRKYSLPGVEKLRPQIGDGVKVQAIGLHSSGYLTQAAEFSAKGPGFVSRDHGSKDFGTDMTVNLLTQAFASVERKYPQRVPIVLGNVSSRTGGKLLNSSGRPHGSHRTGLDADVALPSTRPNNGFFSACGKHGCSPGRGVTEAFDVERFWYFIKQVTCAENQPVIAMFLDKQIKRNVCAYAAAHENMQNDCVVRTLRALRHWPGHDNHVHVRLRCPERTSCQNRNVLLSNGTGC